MKKKWKYFLLFLLFVPIIVFAEDEMTLPEMIGMELFVTIHMTIFFHIPFSYLVTQGEPNKTKFKIILTTLIVGRFLFLLIGDLTVGFPIAMIDFFTVFVGAFGIVPITAAIMHLKHKSLLSSVSNITSTTNLNSNMNNEKVTVMNENTTNNKTCPKCHSLNSGDSLFCTNCGQSLSNTSASPAPSTKPGYCPKCHAKLNPGVIYCVNCGLQVATNAEHPTIETPVSSNLVSEAVESIYYKTEKDILNDIIKEELANNHYDSKKMVPGLRRRRLVFTAIFAVVTFLCICLIFFHLPLLYYFVYFIFLFIYIYNMKKYDINTYLLKQIKSRPDEKIANVVSSVVATAQTEKNTSFEYIAMFILAILLPCVIFYKPRIFYEKMDEGYGVRFYAFGLSNFTSVEIPATYNGEDVVSIRGNGFSNMFFLKSAKLPDTVTEIRGQAFKNDYFLTDVNMPKNLKYLGGGSFYNCESLKEIEFPDSLTYIGGEAFKNASSLESVNIPDGIEEIRGDTFENCSSLREIDIPDSVTRIGGHAFYGDSKLERVGITEKSQLKEIGSSAFRLCDSLYEITIPKSTVVNERAFKESPTTVKRYVTITGVDHSFYQKSSYFYSVGSSVNLYDDKYQVLYIVKLDEKNETASGTTYTFSVLDSSYTTTTFTIKKGDTNKKVTSNFYVELEEESYSSVDLNFYYK